MKFLRNKEEKSDYLFKKRKKSLRRSALEWLLGWFFVFLIIYGIFNVFVYYNYLITQDVLLEFEILLPVASAIIASCVILAVLTGRLFNYFSGYE